MARAIDADAYVEDLMELYEKLKNISDKCESIRDKEIALLQMSLLSECVVILTEQPTIEPKQEWISTKDRLPKKKREYLCVCQFGDDSNWRYYNVLLFHPEKNADNGCVKGPHFSNEGMDDMRVTHWMPLPEPPKEGE